MVSDSASLRVEGLCKGFATVQAVDHLSFDLLPGEIFALLGPNGAGKTTTVRMLTGLVRPDEGRIRYQGLDGQVHDRVPAAELGYLPEERGLYLDQTVVRQLVYFGRLRGMGRRAAEASAREGLERVGLTDRAKEKVSALSKGNQQKVQLLAALLHKPRFAILDEPFSGLDPVNQELALGWIRELRETGTTVLLSAHQMALVERLADRVLLLDHGRAVRFGTVADLRRGEGLSRKLTLAFQSPIEGAILEALPGVVSVEMMGGERAALLLSEEADLNALLGALARGPGLTQVTSEEVDLHEIYLRALGSPREPGKEAACVPSGW